MVCESKNLGEPDDRRVFDHGEVRFANLSGVGFAWADFKPGWRWTQDVKPLVGTESCEILHRAVVISGRLHVRMDDGADLELGPGDAHVVGPGHDAWVVGDEPCVVVEFVPPPSG